MELKGLVSTAAILSILLGTAMPSFAHDRECAKTQKISTHHGLQRAKVVESEPMVIQQTVEPAVVEAPATIASPVVTPIVEACPNNDDVLVRAALFGKHRIAKRARKALRAMTTGCDNAALSTTCGAAF